MSVKSFVKGFKNLQRMKPAQVKAVIEPNLLDDEGNPVEWIFRELNATEIELAAEKLGEKDNFIMALAVKSVVYPDFHSSTLLQELGVGSPLKAIEIATASPKARTRLIKVVNDLHGFGQDTDVKVETIKN